MAVSVTKGAAVGVRAARGRRRARRGRPALAALALLELALLAAGAGCTGAPGLEPPWSDDDEGSARAPTGTNSGGTVSPPTVEGPGSDGFGNPMGGGAGSIAPRGGSGGSMSGTGSAPVGAAGSGSVSPPPATDRDSSTPDAGAPNDPGMGMAGTGAINALAGIDFVPDCDAEMPAALERSEACRYPLADEYPAADIASLQVAALDGGDAALLERGQSTLSCLFGSDYYVDETTTPAAIVLCAEACSALPPTAQLVAIEGCAALP